jgi:hypothetical protein
MRYTRVGFLFAACLFCVSRGDPGDYRVVVNDRYVYRGVMFMCWDLENINQYVLQLCELMVRYGGVDRIFFLAESVLK